jgi:hypothetical protein
VFLDENVCIGFLSSIKMGEGVGEVSFIIITTSNHTLLLHDSLTPHTGISNVQRAQAALRHWHYSYTLERNRKG